MSLIRKQIAKASFLRWWLIVCLQVLAVAIAITFDLHTELWTHDLTKLGFITIGLWAVTTLAIGFWHTRFFRDRIEHLAKVGWFLSETCLALGMMGTVAGFLLMLSSTFGQFNVEDVSTVQSALSDMALGMSTALYTTLVGLITSQMIKVQLVNLEHMIDKSDME